MESEMITCSHCKKELQKDVMFCGQCGNRIFSPRDVNSRKSVKLSKKTILLLLAPMLLFALLLFMTVLLYGTIFYEIGISILVYITFLTIPYYIILFIIKLSRN
jgi:uncharacterized membrane protein YvbJ